MRIGNAAGRLCLFTTEGAVDVERASSGVFPADPQLVFDRWAELTDWVGGAQLDDARPFDPDQLAAPVPRPRQVFGIGLNYRGHAAEAGFTIPAAPAVFTKFATSITGPRGEIILPDGQVDWEVELVVVIGRHGRCIPHAQAWDYVAGLTVGQDLSERSSQLAGPIPQFSLAKSYPGFAPTGPWLVTPDEFADPNDLELGCSVNGESVQFGRTSDMVFSVPTLLERLSAVLPLLPGDLVFTGTPAGVGFARDPQRFLDAGDRLSSYVSGIGDMDHRFVRPVTRMGDDHG